LKLENLLRKLFIAFVIVYIIILAIYFSPILIFIILELYEATPILLPIAIMYYCTIDVLTPNPKHSSIYGLLYAEALEHLFLPATLIMILTTFPAIFMLVFLFLIYYFYGHLLGEIKTFKDVIKVCTLMVLVLAISFYPDIIFFVNVETGIGYIFIIATIIITTILYSTYHLKKMFVDEEVNSFPKFYGVVIVSSIASSIVLNMV
jgi:hypothetical protein